MGSERGPTTIGVTTTHGVEYHRNDQDTGLSHGGLDVQEGINPNK